MSNLAEIRILTGTVRPPGDHGCKPVELLPGLWHAHFHDIDTKEKLLSIAPKTTIVINSATAQCPTQTGTYGEGVTVLRIENFNDDPDSRKKVDMMPDGPEKAAALAALPSPTPAEAPGNALLEFDRVNASIDDARAKGGAAMVHCMASLSRSCVFALGYIMKDQKCTLKEAIAIMKPKWDATWPNDAFVQQLLEYEKTVAK